MEILQFYSDTSAAKTKGFGCCYDREFTWGTWEDGFIENEEPSIAYLEIYVLTVAVHIWSHKLANKRVEIACDNIAAVNIVNSTSSKCKNCMVLV